MKSVFNKAPLLLGALVCGVVSSAPGHAQVYYSVRGLLSDHFKQSEIVDFRRITLSSRTRDQIERQLGERLEKGEYIFYVAHSEDRVDGYALFDREIGQHEYIDFATFFDAQGRVTRVEVVAYREPYGDAIRSERFRNQFVGKSAENRMRAGKDIDVISGATLSAQAMSKAVKRATVLLHDALLPSAS